MFELLTLLAFGGVVTAIFAIRHEKRKRNKAKEDWEHYQRTGNLRRKR